MRVLGIDPGFASVGLAFVHTGEGGHRIEHMETVRTKRSTLKMNIWDDNFSRCGIIATRITELIDWYGPQLVAIEAESWTRTHTDSVVGLGRGVIYGICCAKKIPVSQWHAKTVREHLLGKQSASKEDLDKWLAKNVVDFRLKMEGITKSQQNHASDAAGVAITEILRGQNAKVFMALQAGGTE
jgi:Holliday junction resolvasome RuvABC endonuclease subunit